MKIPLREVAKLQNGLTASEGEQRVVKEKDGTERVILIPHRFASGVIWNRVKTAGLLEAKAREIEKLRLAIADKHGEGGPSVPDKNLALFFKELDEALAAEEEMPLPVFSRSDFNLFEPLTNPHGNIIPASVLGQLGALILAS